MFAYWSCKWIYWRKNGNKYLIFDSVDENKEVLKNTQMFGMELKTKAINGDTENDYGKDYMKIKFKSDDDLPLNKLLKFHKSLWL